MTTLVPVSVDRAPAPQSAVVLSFRKASKEGLNAIQDAEFGLIVRHEISVARTHIGRPLSRTASGFVNAVCPADARLKVPNALRPFRSKLLTARTLAGLSRLC